MAKMDMDAIRAKLQSFEPKEKKEKKENTAFWKPTEGDSIVRMLPYNKEPENPFVELQFHYDFGKKGNHLLSPLSFGESDPIAEFSVELRSQGNMSKEEYKETFKLMPSVRTYVPVIVRGEEDKGVRWWAFGKSVYKDILVAMENGYDNIYDPKEGYDIKVTFTPKEKTKTKMFPETAIFVRPKSVPLSSDAKQIKAWLADQPDLFGMFERKTPADLKDELAKYMNPKASSSPVEETVKKAGDAEWGSEESAPPVSPSAKKSESKLKPTENIASEFDSLFG